MTSEIAVMNQRAVALAADSAVTLVDGAITAVRNDQRKLFQLVDGRPIGAMYFGMADIMGHPWDKLIEHYQQKVHPRAFAHVAEYGQSFVAMLDDLPEFFPKERYQEEYKKLLASVFRYIFQMAQNLRETGGPDRARSSDTELLEEAVERVWNDYQYREDGRTRGNLSCFPPGFGARVAQEYAGVISELIAYGFQPFRLSGANIRRLREIAILAVVKDHFLEDVSGLVFAGFGTADHYPAAITYHVSAVVCGIVKRAPVSRDAIDGVNRSKIRVFADSDVTNAFIRGIDFSMERQVRSGVWSMFAGLIDNVVGAMPDIKPKAKDAWRQRLHADLLPQYFDKFCGMTEDYQQQKFINPVLSVLEISSRSELAETARELILLNAFKKRIMAQKQTVGGAIDVAIISREAGFQWYAHQDGERTYG